MNELLENNFYNLTSLKDRLFLLKAARTSDYQELILEILKLFHPEELAVVEQTLNKG